MLVSEFIELLRRFLGKRRKEKEMNEEFELITVTISLAAKTKTTVDLPQANQLSVQSCKACHVT